MASARVSSLASVVSLQAKNTSGVWRALTEGSVVATGEEILCEADGAQYALTAYKIQRRSSSAWVDATTVTLHTPDGSSNYRQDRLVVTGDATNSTAAIVLTVKRGQRMLADMLVTLKARQNSFFCLEDGTTKFRGIFDDIEQGNKPELGGFEQDFKGTLLCDREQFTGLPAPKRGQKLKCLGDGLTYRIELVKEDEISYAISFVSLNK